MGIKEAIEKFKLVDVQVDLRNFFNKGQFGIVNIQNNYYINVTPENQVFWTNFTASSITPEIEKQSKLATEAKLMPISPELDLLPTDVTASLVTTSVATSAMEYIESLSDKEGNVVKFDSDD